MPSLRFGKRVVIYIIPIKITFDKSNPAETIRARRIVKDMLRRGYALLVEVERGDGKAFERALDFDEARDEYIVADFDPVEAERSDIEEDAANQRRTDERAYGQSEQIQTGIQDVQAETPKGKRGRPKTKGVPAAGTRAVGVARSAGG